MRRHELVYSLNAGGVDKDALSRVDLEKMRLAGEHPVKNWMPRVLGPMSIRPGLESVSRIPSDVKTRIIPFIRDSATTAIMAFRDYAVTVYSSGSPARVSNAASTVLNPSFASALSGSFTTGWKNDSDTGNGTAPSVTTGTELILIARKYRAASVQQAVAIAGGDQATPHTVTIDVTRGPVFVRMGTAQDAEDLMSEAALMTGTHKLTVTPNAAALWIKIRSEAAETERVVDRVQFEHILQGGACDLFLPTPWPEASLPYLSVDQSQDVLFVGDGDVQPRRIERRGGTSWSIVLYQTRFGPLMLPATDKIRLTPSTYTANGSLTSSLPYFTTAHVGALFELTHPEQHVIEELAGSGEATDHITVTGLFSSTIVYNDRNFGVTIDMTTGSFVGTISLERSTDSLAETWAEWKSYTADATATLNDEQSNLLAHYRFRVSAYTSGYALVTITYLAGSKTGLVRATQFVSSTQVYYEVVNPLGGVASTSNWRGPQWTSTLGWPRVPRLFDGRLWWFRGDKAFGSVVDDYDNYNDALEGDSAPVIRSIGSGPAEGARWALDMQRLICGTSGFEASIRSSSFDEPITPTKFTVRNASTLGVSYVPAVKVDRGAIFVQRSGRRLYELMFAGETNDYTSQDVSRLNPGSLLSGVVALAAQRQPDTRVYAVLGDGTCVVLTYERDDKVVAFTTLETAGTIEDVCVLPNDDQDDVYFIVKRNGSERYLERLAGEADQRAVATCATLDAHKVLTGSISSITGGTHLAGQTVTVWADGVYRGTKTLDGSGVAALGATYSRVVYGLPYTAEFLSVKLAYAAQLGTALGQTKTVKAASVILANSCLDGIRVGKDASNTDPLPDYVNGSLRTTSQFVSHYDHDAFPIQSEWASDSRIYVSADSSYGPVTVQAIVLDVETREGVNAQARG